MPRDARQVPPLRPPPVAVHDDRHDGSGSRFAIELFEKLRFLAVRGL